VQYRIMNERCTSSDKTEQIMEKVQ
jgi:hypothetical protein